MRPLIQNQWTGGVDNLTPADRVPKGFVRRAVTFTDADGREGGTDTPLLVTVPEGGALDVELPAPPEGGRVNLYLGYPNSQTLYLQGQGSAATPLRVTSLRDDTRTLTTARLRAPVIGSVICAHGSQLAIAQGRVVWLTAPMRPHLLDPLRGFLQFPAEVGELMSDQTTLYVSSDVSYSLSDVAGDTPSQREILNFPALRGSAVILPDERCAWMTRYGQAVSVGDGSGGLQLVNRQHYAPDLTAQGAAGVIEHNGNQLIVTTTRGPQGANQLAATDFFIGEVVRP